jgi:hypothetical protein
MKKAEGRKLMASFCEADAVKFKFIAKHQSEFPVGLVCRLLKEPIEC